MKPDNRKTKKELINELELMRKKVISHEKKVINTSSSYEQLETGELNILLNAAMELSATLDLNEVMQASTDHIINLTDIGTAAIYLVEENQIYLGAMTPQLDASMPEEFRFALLNNHPHIKKAVTTKKVVTVADTKNEKFSKEEKFIVDQRDLRSIWYIPISLASETIGVFIVSSQGEVKTCSQKTLDLFKALSNIVAIALQNSLLHKELEEKNEELSTTLLSIGDAVISTDINGKVTLMNENAERLCGYNLTEAKEKPLTEIFKIINSKTHKKVDNPVNKVIQDGKRIHLANHTILISKDGKEYQISDSAAPILDRTGQITGVVLVFSDVTKDYALREEIRENKDKLVRAELMGGFGNWEIDLANKKISGSAGAAAVYGVGGESFQLENIQKLPLPEYRQLLDESLYKLVNENRPYDIEFKLQRPDGSIRIVHSTAKYDSNSNKIFGVLHDITERKQAEEALKISEERYREFFLKDLTGDFLSTVEGKIIDCNPALLSILGYNSLEEIQKHSANNFYPGNDDRQKFLNLIRSEREVTSYEMKMKKSDGSIITVLENVVGIFNEKDELTHLRGYLFDITDRKSAEDDIIKAKEKAEAADRLKTEFLAQMSHEIRSPLNAVLSFTGLIQELTSDISCEELDTCYSGIGSASERIIRTIDSILNMSDLQLGTYQIVKRKLDLVDLLRKVKLEYDKTARNKNLELRLKTNTDEHVALIDEYAIGQIVINLLDNAVKYTTKGFIEIELKVSDKTSITIKDTGIGISKEYLPNLFTPFTQEEQGYTRSYDGNGLGLALVKKYCDTLNADISVNSKKNFGTTFTISLGDDL